MPMRGRHAVVACVATVVVLAVGCSSDDRANDADGDDGVGASTESTTGAEEPTTSGTSGSARVQEYEVPAGSHPHDVAVAEDGTVWYTAQGSGELGRLTPGSGEVDEIALGEGSRPHGVILGPGGAPWITDGGLNAIVRVDPASSEVQTFPLPTNDDANLNTAVFDGDGTLWFTGQSGIYGRLDADVGSGSPGRRGRAVL